jgi:serine/threonine protein kinase
MTVASAESLLEVIRRHHLLTPEQIAQLRPEVLLPGLDGKGLAKELLRRGWLTRFQVKHLLLGHGDRLVLGPYLLLEKVGEGGMGQVFKARQRRLGRVVALKVLRPGSFDGPGRARRFRREARAAGRLAHPNIVSVFDAGQVGPAHLLAMEFIDGIDLGRRVREQGPLPVVSACDAARQAALGLQHAHERGLVHRDVKPSNLIVDGGGVVKLLDLGLVRSLPGDASAETVSGPLTEAGLVLGTPDFMAPEQARDSSTVDARADLYSLGGSLYYLLTGRVPFPGGTAVEKLIRHTTEEPAPVESLRPEVPGGLAEVVRRLMARDPGERYASAAEAAAALAPFSSASATHLLATIPTSAPEESPFAFDDLTSGPPLSTLPRAGRRRPWVLWVAALGSIGLSLAVAVEAARRYAPSRPAEPPHTVADPAHERVTPAVQRSTPTHPALGPVRPYLPDDAGLVAVIDVRQVVHDPVIARHLGTAREALRRQFAGLGLDPAESVERITLSLRRDDPRRLVLVADHEPLPSGFYQQLERQHAKKTLALGPGKTEVAYEVRLPDPPRPAWLAVLGPKALALATDDRDLQELLAKPAGRPAKLHDADLAGLLTGRDAAAALWLGASGRQQWEDRQPTLRDAAGVHAWRVQARLSDGLEADLEATTDQPAAAKQFLGMLMLSAGQKLLVGKLLLGAQKSEHREGPLTRIRLRGRLTPDELDESVRRLLESAAKP